MPKIIRCPSCGKETYAGLLKCPHCDGLSRRQDESHSGSAPVPADEQRRDWVALPKFLAAQHPLYGAGGWAAVLALALVILPLMAGAADLAQLERMQAWTVDWEPASILTGIDKVIFVWSLTCACLLALRRKAFLPVFYALAVAVIVAVPVQVALLAEIPALFRTAGGMTHVWPAVGMLVAVPYVLVSKRTNVTLRHRVRPWDPFVRGIDAEAARPTRPTDDPPTSELYSKRLGEMK